MTSRRSLLVEMLEERAVPTVGQTISIADPEPVVEGDDGVTSLLFEVTRSGDTFGNIAIDYTLLSNTGVENEDFFDTGDGTLILADGEDSAFIEIGILGDNNTEPTESFQVQLSNARFLDVEFASPENFSIGSGFSTIIADDFDQNGLVDIVTITEDTFNEEDVLNIYRNTGQFGPQPSRFELSSTTILSQGNYQSVSADFNNDGLPDLVNLSFFAGVIEILENTSDVNGTPTLSVVEFGIEPTGEPYILEAADVNQDGKVDLIIDQGAGTFEIFLNQSNNNTFDFASPQTINLGRGTIIDDIIPTDLNQDGKIDLVVRNLSLADNEEILFLLNITANGGSTVSFTAAGTVPVILEQMNVKLSDMNGDGVEDLLYQHWDTGIVTVQLNQTSAGANTVTFGPTANFQGSGSVVDYFAEDLTGDGLNELVIVEGSGGGQIFLNQTSVEDSTVNLSSSGNIASSSGGLFIDILAEDVNNDGLSDVIRLEVVDEGGELGADPSSFFSVLLNSSGSQFIEIEDAVAQGTVLNDDSTPTVTFTSNQNAGPGSVLVVTAVNQTFTTPVASFTTNFLSTPQDFEATINWGDGTFTEGIITGSPSGFHVTGTHTYTTEDTFLVDVEVSSLVFEEVEATTVPSAAVVLTPNQNGQVTDSGFQRTDPGARLASAQANGVRAALVDPNRAGSTLTLFVARYGTNPEDDPIEDGDFFDVRVTGASEDGELAVTFEFTGDPTQVQLLFLDPSTNTYQPVLGSTLNPSSLQLDTTNKTITVVFDSTSFPTLQELRGTVFSIGVSSSSQGSLSPAVSLAANRQGISRAFAASKSVRFRSSSQLSISLTASQDSAGSGSIQSLKRTALEQEPVGEPNAEAFTEVIENLIQAMKESLQDMSNNWLNDLFQFMPGLMEGVTFPESTMMTPTEVDEVFMVADGHEELSDPQLFESEDDSSWSPALLGLLGVGAVLPRRNDRQRITSIFHSEPRP